MAKLKPISRFRPDVEKGDLVRIVFNDHFRGTVSRAGYMANVDMCPPYDVCLMKDESEITTLEADKGENWFKFEDAIGYEVLRRQK